MEYAVTELKGAGGGDKHRLPVIPGRLPVVLHHPIGHCRVGINEIVMLLPDLGDDGAGLGLVAEAAVEIRLELGLDLLGDGIASLLPQLLHIAGHLLVVLARQGEEETL